MVFYIIMGFKLKSFCIFSKLKVVYKKFTMLFFIISFMVKVDL
jgi:hypothetical protein